MDVLSGKLVENQQLREDSRADVLELHRTVSVRIASHLQLTMDNVARFNWLLGGMLVASPVEAQESARLAHQQLVSKSARSPLAVDIAGSDSLMRELCLFCDASPAIPLWKGRGRFQGLFRYLACRFLSSPDHVLDCEGVHSRWQWIEHNKRSINIKMLNAVLRLSSYINHFGDPPAMDELVPHIQAIRHHHHQQYLLVRAGGEVAPGARAEWLYRERFNLSLADIDILRPAVHRPLGGSASPQVLQTIEKSVCVCVCAPRSGFRFIGNIWMDVVMCIATFQCTSRVERQHHRTSEHR